MQPIAYLVKVTLPEYLASLPIPDTIGGWFGLSSKYILLYCFKLLDRHTQFYQIRFLLVLVTIFVATN